MLFVVDQCLWAYPVDAEAVSCLSNESTEAPMPRRTAIVTQKYAHLYPSAVESLAERLDERARSGKMQRVGLAWG